MNDDNNQFAGTIYIDSQLDSYKNYLDDERIGNIANQLNKDSVLGKHFFILLMELRGIACNASFPYIITEVSNFIYNTYIPTINPRNTLLDFASAIMTRLSKEIPQLTKRNRISRKIKDRLIVMSQDYLDMDKKLQLVNHNDIWENFINTRNYVFRHTVWSNQRVSYLSAFSAYDNFIVKIVKDKLKLDKYRRTNNDFNKDIKRIFGEETGKIVWNDGELLVLRKIRNSLAHEGGKTSDPLTLMELKQECVLKDDVIQITPKDIKRLFSAITSAVEAIVNHSVNDV